MKNENNYATRFSNYLKNNKSICVAVISPNQYAIEIDKDFSHEGMRLDLIRKTRPNMKMDNWGNAIDPNDDYRNDTIVILGSPGNIWIEFPLKQKLNIEQYKCLYSILIDIYNYNKQIDKNNSGKKYEVMAFGLGVVEIEAKDYSNDVNELINKVIPYVDDKKDIVLDEVIIGSEFQNVATGKEIDKTLDEIENNTMDVGDNPILGPESEYKFMTKGYSNIVILIFITSIVSMIILLLGMFIDLN